MIHACNSLTNDSVSGPLIPTLPLPPTRSSISSRKTGDDKLRGGYYTPLKVAEWLCNWAITRPTETILEPSCGDGIFLQAAALCLGKIGCKPGFFAKQITAVELKKSEALTGRDKFNNIFGKDTAPQIVTDDFFNWFLTNSEKRFDVVVGNPPFIRYQNFPEPSRSLAMEVMRKEGLRPNKLTNTWVPFIVAATVSLKPNGKLAMVVPAELLQVTYAAQLRTYLVERFRRIEIVACNEMFFENAQQEVVLLLAEGKLLSPSRNNRCILNLSASATVDEITRSKPAAPPKYPKFVEHDNEKWLKYFLEAAEIDFMRQMRLSRDVVNLRAHAEVDVGLVTGENDFFILTNEQLLTRGIEGFGKPIVGRSAQLQGAIYRPSDHKRLAKENQRNTLFYVPPNVNGSLTEAARQYILSGEKQGIQKGYKCSIRKPWYSVPSVWVPDCFLFRQIYDFPRAVLNNSDSTSTDTIHRMTCSADPKQVVANIYTHLTAASAEIEGRSYGGGVLELEPTEAERLLMPKSLKGGMPIDLLDVEIRNGRLQTVLEEHDRLILMDEVGLTKRECMMLRNIWNKMRERRLSRKKRKN